MGAGGKAAKARRAARVSLWVARASTTVLLWTCVVLLAAAFGERLAPSVLGGVWSGCLTQTLVIVQRQPLLLPGDRERAVATAVSTIAAAAVALPPKSKSVVSCLFSPLSLPYLPEFS
jgi:hypothetical protein